MNIVSKLGVFAAALFTAQTHAATATADIPMSVEVPRVCTISASPSIVIPRDGSEGTGSFRVTCNVDSHSFYMTTDSLDAGTMHLTNANGYELPINLKYSFIINSQYTWTDVALTSRKTWYHGTISPLDTILKVKLNTPTTALTPAGTYIDTFRVNVTY